MGCSERKRYYSQTICNINILQGDLKIVGSGVKRSERLHSAPVYDLFIFNREATSASNNCDIFRGWGITGLLSKS